MKYINEQGEWKVDGGIKYLVKPSESYKKEKKEDKKKNNNNLKKEVLRQSIAATDKKILQQLPEFISRILPVLEQMGFKLTKEEKKLIDEREEMLEAYNKIK